MRVIDRYIVREMIVPFLVGTLAVVLMFQANAYIYIAKSWNLENVPWIARFQWILYSTPGYLKLTLPTGTSLAAALTMTRLARESELTAMRAAGARILRTILPIFAFGVVIAVGDFYLVDRIIPPATQKANAIFSQNALLGLSKNTFKSNALIQLDRFSASFGAVSKGTDESLFIRDVLLIERVESAVTTMITSKTATYRGGTWTFPDSVMYRVEGGDISLVKSDSLTIHQEIVIDQLFSNGMSGNYEETPTPELRASIESARRTKGDPRPFEVELYQRYAVAASCAVFALTSPIFAVFFARSGGFVGVLVSFVVVLLYYNVYIISTMILGKIDAVPAWLAAWLPNLVFGILGVAAIRKLE